MKSLIAIAALVACSGVWAEDCDDPGDGFSPPTKCGLHQLNNNEVADADKVMSNFNVLGDAIDGIGGCTATQQDNSVLIECADGSSGVLAGAGTVVVIPEGAVTGEPPDYSDIPIGDFYWEDGNGVLIGAYNGSCCAPVTEIPITTNDGKPMMFWQDDSRQLVKATGGHSLFHFAEADCQGILIKRDQGGVAYYENKYWVDGPHIGGETLIRSWRYADYFNRSTWEYEADECKNYETPFPGDGFVIVEYDPPAEWLNAAYPLTLVQKP